MPSCSTVRMRQPPPGHTITPTPFGLAGLNTLSVGSDTLRSIAVSPEVPTGPRNATSGPIPSSLDGGPSGQSGITWSGRLVMDGYLKQLGVARHLYQRFHFRCFAMDGVVSPERLDQTKKHTIYIRSRTQHRAWQLG